MAVSVSACGPDFPPTILDRADDAIRTMPEADFRTEIESLLPGAGAVERTEADEYRPTPINDPWLNTVRADVADLEAALRTSPLAAAEARRRVDAYREFRVLAGGYEPMLAQIQARSWWQFRNLTNDLSVAAPPVALDPPAGLPREFDHYARGMVAYRLGRVASARDWWRALLQLPSADRQFKSIWAAYMLGRTQPDDEATMAAAWYGLVRDLAAHGYRDSLDLATESLGWEAQSALRVGHYERAAQLYLAQYGAGDGGALVSLQVVARRVLAAGPDRIEAAARDVCLQRVITAYLVSRSYPWDEAPSAEEAAFWLAALQHSGLRPVDGADRLAWLAYEHGDFDGAGRWLAVASTNGLTARWLAAKLSMRRGDRDRAQAILAGLVPGLDAGGVLPSFVATERARGQPAGSQVAGELAALLMSGGRYVEALDLLLRHGWWTDSAYVAERVLKTDELRAYVDRTWPVQPPSESELGPWWAQASRTNADTQACTIRYVLGRRLAREGHYAEAVGYYPFRWRPWLAQYEECLARGRDARRSEAERATRLWRAARLMRYLGMELFGTETDPDWHEWGGAYDLGEFGQARAGTNGPALAPVRPDEEKRVAQHAVSPNERFHYRYQAADLAWEAVALMPDEASVTAQVLCEAGSWMKRRDPKAANRFYKALVRRCGKTELGKAAAKSHWFLPATFPGISTEGTAGEER